jgi:hypothetical protein
MIRLREQRATGLFTGMVTQKFVSQPWSGCLAGASLFPCYQAIDIAAKIWFGLLFVAM